MEEYRQTLDSLKETVMGMYKSTEWIAIKTSEDETISKMRSPSNPAANAFRVDGSVEATVDELLNVFLPSVFGGVWDKWDDNVDRVQLIDDWKEEDVRIFYTVSKSMASGLISPRDFVSIHCTKWCLEENITFCCSASIEHDGFPVTKCAVRAWSYAGGVVIRSSKIEGVLDYTCITDNDFAGSVPRFLVERQMPLILSEYKAGIQKGLIIIRGQNDTQTAQ